jgi:hypothetical protein
MLTKWLFLAASLPPGPNGEPVQPAPLSSSSGLALQDILLLVGVVLVVALLLFAWVYLTRRNSRQTHSEMGGRLLYKPERRDGEHGGRRMRVKRKRRSHPENLPRNPTLAEAGGLPPIRPEEPSEPVK